MPRGAKISLYAEGYLICRMLETKADGRDFITEKGQVILWYILSGQEAVRRI